MSFHLVAGSKFTARRHADELRRQADVFIDLVELRSKVDRDSLERAAPALTASSRAAIPLPRATTMAPRGNDDRFDD